jgi:metal-dependent amidase/aminoacylase/carboxypeptidase family protein
MTKIELAAIADKQIDRNLEKIFNFAGSIIREPEEGFREEKTAAKVKAVFDELNIEYRDGLAVTGVKGVLEGGKKGPTVAILAELDALINRDHPLANKDSGAVHACGHFAQLAQTCRAGGFLCRTLRGVYQPRISTAVER